MGHISAICLPLYQLFVYIFAVVSQEYSTRANDVYVIIGNSALMKCEIPSFVADFVSVHSWVTNEGDEFFSKSSIMGTLFLTFFWEIGHTS